MSGVKTILGTMTFGPPTEGTASMFAKQIVEQKDVEELLNIFYEDQGADVAEIDTARMYQGGNTEKCLGIAYGKDGLPRPITATKVLCRCGCAFSFMPWCHACSFTSP